ncbi:MAG: alpha/beta hydrolase [Bacteroidetes bacterium]|nr:alpha/beta hydrolase [Bacteroidota bacterium]
MPEENWLEINGQKICYRDIGRGICTVLIHGFAEDGRIWDKQIDALKNDYRLIIPDLPGSGRSIMDSHGPNAKNPLTMEDYASLIKGLLDKEKIDSCILIGHSMGGYITLAFAEKYPEMLAGFALVHSTAYADSEEKKALRQKSIGFIQKNGSADFIRQSTPNLFSDFTQKNRPEIIEEIIERYDNFKPESLVSYYEAMILRPDRAGLLKNFKRPIMFIIGEKDNIVPLEDSLRLSHLPTISYIHILENTGHMGMLESTPELNKYLKDFIIKVGV